MGRKVHPLGFRIGVIRSWQAKWYADKSYAGLLHEDLQLRRAIQTKYTDAGISLVELDHQANKVLATIHTARPGIVIGRGGQRVDEMRRYLEGLVGDKIQLNIQEIQQPELDAYLVARSIADQIEHRVAFRRVMKQAIFRTMQAGAKGIKICCSGRLAGAEIARREKMHEGRVPLQTLRADIDYGFAEAHTTLGRIGIKTWIYKGEILPESKVVEAEEVAKPEATGSVTPDAVTPVVAVAKLETAAEVTAETKPAVAMEKEEKNATA
ncbi:MAG: 30S ribosomal protein S3 [Dehalococcoidales bacterium]|nr:30S ribosomal protein S3 [Dehalococcoidales bacterium]